MIGQTITPEMVSNINTEAKMAAKTAVANFLNDWNTKTGGNEYGEPMYCGFAWVNIEVNGATKLGRLMKKMGIDKRVGNPGGYRGQSMDIREVGAEKFVEVMRANNLKAYAYSRAD